MSPRGLVFSEITWEFLIFATTWDFFVVTETPAHLSVLEHALMMLSFASSAVAPHLWDIRTTQGLLAPTKASRNMTVVLKTQTEKAHFSAMPSVPPCLPSGSPPSANGLCVAVTPQKPIFSFALLYCLRNCDLKVKQN